MAASFDFQKRLGSGYFGEVWLVRDMGLNAERALKVIPPDRVINPKNFFQEAQLLKSVEHANIVRVEETGTLDDGRIYVAMEYLPKGSVEDEAQGRYLPLSRAKQLMIDVLRGLEYAHSRGVLHRDVKPANILIGNQREGKLSDFGLAIPVGVDPKTLGMKDYGYAIHVAPEVRKAGDYNELTDLYACAATFYRLINGDSYLQPVTPQEAQDLARKGRFPDRTKYRDFVPRPFRLVVNRGLSVKPSERFQSASEMRHAIERLAVVVDWSEKKVPNGTEWIGVGLDGKKYVVVRQKQANGLWQVNFKKGRFDVRRDGALCIADVRAPRADQHARKLLQRLTIGK
jgi:eukaryotic-like serine/threonine-protein kinase